MSVASKSVAIITGASMGFGRAFAEELAGDGWDLVIDARHQQPLEAAAAGLRKHGGTVVAVAGDVTDPDAPPGPGRGGHQPSDPCASWSTTPARWERARSPGSPIIPSTR